MTLPRFPLPKLNVREKILIVFLALSVISLLVTGYVALFTISGLAHSAESSSMEQGRQAVDKASDALLESEEDYLIQAASDQAQITNFLLEDTETELTLLAVQATTLQNNPPVQPLIHSYNLNTPPADTMEATLSYVVPAGAATVDSVEFRRSAGMDDLLKGTYDTDTNFTSVYLATDSGILRVYPWGSPDLKGFDPRQRDWFTGAKRDPDVYWSVPYVDSFGHGLIVTSSKAVPTPDGAWVIAGDVKVDVINSAFMNRTLKGKGYAVLMDSRGNIISRPDMSTGNYTWKEPFPQENVFSSPDPALVAVGRNMTAGKTGVERVWFGGKESFVAYAPVTSVNWSVALTLPVQEVTAPIDQTRAGIVVSGNEAEEEIARKSQQVMILFSLLFCILLVIVIVLAVNLSKVITRPIDTLKRAALALGQGDLEHRVDLQTGDEFEDLGNSFNRMASDLRQNIEELRRTTTEKERYAREMEIAREIQDTFLPETPPEIPGFEICATTIPAMEIGGDLYDFILIPDNRWGFVIGDVSGKGVSAALYMALCRTQIHTCGGELENPSDAIRKANRLIFDEGRSSMFITVFYAVLDPARMTLSWVNAGHNPPLLVRGKGPEVQMFEGRGIALGVIDDVDIPERTVPVERGDLIFLYTDGVTEAFNTADEYYGEERMIAVVRRNRSRPANEIRDALLEDIRQFTGTAPQSDDITFILIKVL